MICVRDLYHLDYFQKEKMELLGGAGGLDRAVVSANFIQLFTFDQWMKGGEFLLVNGIGLHLEHSENIIKIITKANAKNVACIIFMINQYLPKIPDEAVTLANELDFPIFLIPHEPPFSECISVVYDYILRKRSEETSIAKLTRNLLLFDTDTLLLPQQLKESGYCDPGYRIAVFAAYQKNGSGEAQEWDFCLHHLYQEILLHYPQPGNDSGYHPLYMILSNKLTVFLPLQDRGQTETVLWKSLQSFSAGNDNIYFSVGCGKYYENICDYKKSYHEALHCHKALQSKTTQVLFYENLGILRLCFDTSSPGLITEYINGLLQPVFSYDRANNTQMFHILKTYIAENFNATRASQRLYVHRNTMIQRISKLEKLLDADFEDADFRREISTAVYLSQFYTVQ